MVIESRHLKWISRLRDTTSQTLVYRKLMPPFVATFNTTFCCKFLNITLELGLKFLASLPLSRTINSFNTIRLLPFRQLSSMIVTVALTRQAINGYSLILLKLSLFLDKGNDAESVKPILTGVFFNIDFALPLGGLYCCVPCCKFIF